MTAADRPSVPRVGDTITTAEQLDTLPSLTVVMDTNGEVQQRHGHLTTQDGDYSAWLGVMPPTCKPSPEVALPATVLYVPGDSPSVTDNARAKGQAAGYASGYGDGYEAGWAAGRAETTTGAIARGEALAAGDPDWMNVTRWPQDATTTATTEDAARVLDDVIQHLRKIWSTGHDEAREVIDTAEELLAQALPRLLATARTRPTRDKLALTIFGTLARHFEVVAGQLDGINAAADAVLALYADQPTEAEAGARALEQAAEWLRSDMDEPWGDRAANRLDVRAARIRAGGA